MEILFYDNSTPLAYDASTSQTRALGGTEATVIRIANSLKNNHHIYVAQHCRATANNTISQGVHYISLETAHNLKPEVVILLRQYRLAEEIAKRYPQARRYLWLHNMPAKDLLVWREALAKHHYHLIAVSHFHRRAIEKRLHGKWYQNIFKPGFQLKDLPITVIYNPIDDHLQPDNSIVHPNQLLFMSSPQKGLTQTLEKFEAVLKTYPEYQLLIANPGYNMMDIQLPQQARILGALPHSQIIQHLRESFCVFYPQNIRVETFGLIYAEANAVGTPVLAHEAGAAREVLSDENQLVDGRKLAAILEKLQEWRQRRPQLSGKPEFRLSVVRRAWLDMLQ